MARCGWWPGIAGIIEILLSVSGFNLEANNELFFQLCVYLAFFLLLFLRNAEKISARYFS
jgi:hypothetical protein